MANYRVPPLFYDFAASVVDLTPDYTSTNKELVLVALDNFPQQDRLKRLRELRVLLADFASGRYSEAELMAFWRGTNARVYPRPYKAFFKEALPILDRYIAKGGARRRWGEEE